VKLWGFNSGFWQKQFKIITVFSLLTVCGLAVSARWECDYLREEGIISLDDPRWRAPDILDEIAASLHHARPETISVDGGPENIPLSRLALQTRDGRTVSYFEQQGTLYREENGTRREILKDLSMAVFQMAGQSILVELHVWSTNARTGELELLTWERRPRYGSQPFLEDRS